MDADDDTGEAGKEEEGCEYRDPASPGEHADHGDGGGYGGVIGGEAVVGGVLDEEDGIVVGDEGALFDDEVAGNEDEAGGYDEREGGGGGDKESEREVPAELGEAEDSEEAGEDVDAIVGEKACGGVEGADVASQAIDAVEKEFVHGLSLTRRAAGPQLVRACSFTASFGLAL